MAFGSIFDVWKIFETMIGRDVHYVTDREAERLPGISISRKVIAETMATLPVLVQQKQGDHWVTVDHEASDLLNTKPNDYDQPLPVKEAIFSDAFFGPAGYALVDRDELTGRVTGYYHIPRNQIVVVSTIDPRKPWSYSFNGDALKPQDLLRIVGPTCNGREGHKLHEIAQRTLSIAASMDKYAQGFFNSSGKGRGKWTLPALKDEDKQRQWEEKLNAESGPENAFKDRIIPPGFTYEPGQTPSNNEAQFTEARQQNLLDQFRFTGVPPTLGLDYSRGTWNNSQEMNRRFLEYCIIPWCRRAEQAYQLTFLLPSELRTHRIVHDFSHLLRADPEVRVAANVASCGRPYETVAEVRAREGYPHIEGTDTLLIPTSVYNPANDPPTNDQQGDQNGNPGTPDATNGDK